MKRCSECGHSWVDDLENMGIWGLLGSSLMALCWVGSTL